MRHLYRVREDPAIYDLTQLSKVSVFDVLPQLEEKVSKSKENIVFDQ